MLLLFITGPIISVCLVRDFESDGLGALSDLEAFLEIGHGLCIGNLPHFFAIF